MTKQLLIYERAVPVSSQRHRDWSVRAGDGFGFARGVNSVPLLAVEFPTAAPEYAIVFAGNERTVMPAVILSVLEHDNQFLGEDDSWQARYTPAFIRRYPFVFSSADEGQNFTLCIDEEFPGCNSEGKGERLFDADGEQTQYLRGVLGFLQQYQVQFQRTEAFCNKLVELELLDPMQAQVRTADNQQAALTGFQAVNRERLKSLPEDKAAELLRTDELELIYLHLQSMRNFQAMAERMGAAATTDVEVGENP